MLFPLGTLSASKVDSHLLRVMFTSLPMSMSVMMNGAMVHCLTRLSPVAAWQTSKYIVVIADS